MSTIEKIQSNVMAPEAFLAHYREMRNTKRAKEEASAGHKAARERFKAAGGDLNAMKIVDHLSGLDDAEAELRMREMIRYAAWLGEWQAEQDGYKAGKAAEPIDNNPHAGGSPYFSRWRQGWTDGQASIAASMKGGK
jgi:hypothetical protein